MGRLWVQWYGDVICFCTKEKRFSDVNWSTIELIKIFYLFAVRNEINRPNPRERMQFNWLNLGVLVHRQEAGQEIP
jgi:hypothetical protein